MMSDQPFFTLLKLTIQLQELRDTDSPEADDLRDAMDEPWYKLNPAQALLVKAVTAGILEEKRGVVRVSNIK